MLVNIAAEPLNWLSVIVRVAFAIVLACHIPYVFFYGKQGLLILIDEMAHNSTSEQLKRKKRALEYQEEEPAYLNMNKWL